MKQIEKMIGWSSAPSRNPYKVNVITFSGHGIAVDRDAIAVIPQKVGDKKEARFINMSGLARRFAEKEFTINFFLMSMCRIIKDSDSFAHLKEDALTKADKFEGYP